MTPPSLLRARLCVGLLWLLASFPLAWLGLFYLFVLRARLALGHWPTPYHPDPTDVGLDWHWAALEWGLLLMPWLFLGTIALAISGRLLGLFPRIWPALTVLACSIILIIALGQLDPGKFFAWFGD